jgi:hypothetical protein
MEENTRRVYPSLRDMIREYRRQGRNRANIPRDLPVVIYVSRCYEEAESHE